MGKNLPGQQTFLSLSTNITKTEIRIHFNDIDTYFKTN